MDDFQKYLHWLVRARGIENPSNEEVKEFKRRAERHRPYGSILELLKIVRRDAGSDYSGTRAYLVFQGLSDPSAEDLIYFHRKIRRALLWRASVAFLVVTIGYAYLWYMHLLSFR